MHMIASAVILEVRCSFGGIESLSESVSPLQTSFDEEARFWG